MLAKRLYPTLSSAQAFAKFFRADTPESLACRQAIQKLKRHPVAEAAPRKASEIVCDEEEIYLALAKRQ